MEEDRVENLTAKKMTLCERTEQRSVIKFCVGAGMTPTDTWKFLERGNQARTCSRSIVFDWHKRFRDGRTSVTDDDRAGRPAVHQSCVNQVNNMISADRRRSLDEIGNSVGLSHGSVHNVLKHDLNMSKVCARWVPRLLTPDNKEVRVEASKAFLRRWRREGDRFLNRVVTTDETWLSYFDPESKQESMVWKRAGSPPPKKAKVVRSTKKVMYIFFMDNQGMLLQHAVPSDKTVNKSYYQKVIRRDLINAIRKKREHAEIENIIFHQDNAPPHRAHDTLMTIDFLGFERIDHAPYSPDLAPMDFAVFPRLKSDLRGRHFTTHQELQYTVRSTIAGYEQSWYKDIYTKWVARHEKCIRAGGEYFEKE